VKRFRGRYLGTGGRTEQQHWALRTKLAGSLAGVMLSDLRAGDDGPYRGASAFLDDDNLSEAEAEAEVLVRSLVRP
jgi:hypothetical protein